MKKFFKRDLSKFKEEEIATLKISALKPKRIKTLRPEQFRWLTEVQVNQLTREHRDVLEQRQRTALWERENVLRKAKATDPQKGVSAEELNALNLAQRGINFVREILVYKSANQAEDIDSSLGTDMQTLVEGRNISGTRQIHATLDELKKAASHLAENDIAGLSAGLAAYHGTGNCPQYRDLAYCFLVKFGYPGLTIKRCSSLVDDHAFVLIEGANVDGTRFQIACDAWPANNAQAVLWQDHPHYYGHGEEGEAYRVKSSFQITPENVGTDLQEEAFNRVDPDLLRMIKPAGLVPSLSEYERLRRKDQNAYSNQHSIITEQFQGYIDRESGLHFSYSGKATSPADDQNISTNESRTGRLPIVFNSRLTASTISLNVDDVAWKASIKIDLSQEEIERIRGEAEKLAEQEAKAHPYLPKRSVYQRMLHIAKQKMGERYQELKKLDELARAAGMSHGIKVSSKSISASELELGSEVVLMSSDKSRVYFRRNRPGSSHNHWKIAMLDGTQEIQIGSEIKSAKNLRIHDVVGKPVIQDSDIQKQIPDDNGAHSGGSSHSKRKGRG